MRATKPYACSVSNCATADSLDAAVDYTEAADVAPPDALVRHGVMTNSSLRLLRWMSDYAELMRCVIRCQRNIYRSQLQVHCMTHADLVVEGRRCYMTQTHVAECSSKSGSG